MAWQELTPPAPSSDKVAKAPVKFAITMTRSAKEARAQLVIAIDLLRDIGGVAVGTPQEWRLRLYAGGGESAGWLRIEPDGAGLFVGRAAPRGKSIVVRLDRPAGYPNERRAAVPVESRIVGSGIEVRLPGLPAAPIAAAAAERPSTSPLPPRPPSKSRDVTAGLMGDPKPGRSAADQKKGS